MDMMVELEKSLEANNNKLSYEFVDKVMKSSKRQFFTAFNTVVCVLELPTGHNAVGYASVLDRKNHVQQIGEEAALEDAKEQVWATLGCLAKTIMYKKRKGNANE